MYPLSVALSLTSTLVCLGALSADPLAGSVEGSALIDGDRIRDGGRAGEELITAQVRSSWTVRPSVDYALNDHILVGGELGIGWLGVSDEPESSAPRRLTLTPHARLRMDFPLSCALVVEGVLGVGFSVWGEGQGVKALLH